MGDQILKNWLESTVNQPINKHRSASSRIIVSIYTYIWYIYDMDFFLKYLLINYFFVSTFFFPLSVTQKLYLSEPLLQYLPQHFSPIWFSANVWFDPQNLMWTRNPGNMWFFFYMQVSKVERSLSPVLSTFFRHSFATDLASNLLCDV